jgi:methylphosphotriester-DNA--protein-cysteine methyltransferase
MLCKKCHAAQDRKDICQVLTDSQILEINKQMKEGATFKEIRSFYGISNDTIRRLYKGKFNKLDWSFLIKRRHSINSISFQKMKQMLLDGYFTNEIADYLDINHRYIPDLFKSLAGITIKQFLKKHKITRSYNRLKELATKKIGGKD